MGLVDVITNAPLHAATVTRVRDPFSDPLFLGVYQRLPGCFAVSNRRHQLFVVYLTAVAFQTWLLADDIQRPAAVSECVEREAVVCCRGLVTVALFYK